MSLATKAVLAELHISQWYNRVNDLRAKADVAEKHGIDNRDDLYIKRPIPKSAFKRIESAISRIRNYHAMMTLPWGAGGMRMLPSKDVFRYSQHMAELKGALEQEVQELALRMEDWKDVARETRKDTFNAEDYPSPEVFRESFRVQTGFFELPVGDFRVLAGVEETEEVRKQLTEHYENSLRNLNENLFNALMDKLQKMSDSMTSKIFRKECFINVGEHIELVRSLGLENTPLMKKAIADAELLTTSNQIIVLQNDPDARLMLHNATERTISELKAKAKSQESSEASVRSDNVTVDTPV